jgi:hypothetical protein
LDTSFIRQHQLRGRRDRVQIEGDGQDRTDIVATRVKGEEASSERKGISRHLHSCCTARVEEGAKLPATGKRGASDDGEEGVDEPLDRGERTLATDEEGVGKSRVGTHLAPLLAYAAAHPAWPRLPLAPLARSSRLAGLGWSSPTPPVSVPGRSSPVQPVPLRTGGK